MGGKGRERFVLDAVERLIPFMERITLAIQRVDDSGFHAATQTFLDAMADELDCAHKGGHDCVLAQIRRAVDSGNLLVDVGPGGIAALEKALH